MKRKKKRLFFLFYFCWININGEESRLIVFAKTISRFLIVKYANLAALTLYYLVEFE